MKPSYVLMGMAIQSFMTAILTQFQIIHPTPAYQFLLGLLFVMIYALQTIAEQRESHD